MNTVENFDLYAPRLVDKEEYFAAGHRACSGCGEALAIRLMCKALGEDTVIVNATGCMEVVSVMYPTTAWNLPWIHVAFPNAASVGSGVEAALKVLRRKGKIADRRIKVVAIGGDGGTFDIGFQALSGAMERGHDLLYVCFDNEAYMNTGIQRSGLTPIYAATTTTPVASESRGKKSNKKNVPFIMAAHNIPYVATASVAYPNDLIGKLQYAKTIKGFKYLHVQSPCPTGWGFDPARTIKVARLMVESGMWPLYEINEGNFKLTYKPRELKPVREALSLQGRFRHLDDSEYEYIQGRAVEHWRQLLDVDGKKLPL
ncbi:TPA: pyruvate synthase subunit beta [Candidatus Bathyarchaeota archaeon]|nr:pyruvate synthase subunit beta [Candidatus Bathyarchaeota archaeon]